MTDEPFEVIPPGSLTVRGHRAEALRLLAKVNARNQHELNVELLLRAQVHATLAQSAEHV